LPPTYIGLKKSETKLNFIKKISEIKKNKGIMHFHLEKKNKIEARIKIPKELPSQISELEIMEYTFQKSKKYKVTNQDLEHLMEDYLSKGF
jgi:hypothetical protein